MATSPIYKKEHLYFFIRIIKIFIQRWKINNGNKKICFYYNTLSINQYLIIDNQKHGMSKTPFQDKTIIKYFIFIINSIPVCVCVFME